MTQEPVGVRATQKCVLQSDSLTHLESLFQNVWITLESLLGADPHKVTLKSLFYLNNSGPTTSSQKRADFHISTADRIIDSPHLLWICLSSVGNASLFTKFLFAISVTLNPPPPKTAKWWISSWISIKRPSNRIANTAPKLWTNPPKIANKQNYEQTGVSDSWRVPNPPLANPLVAERAFRASEYWCLTRVPEVHGKWQESVGISNRLLTPATPRFVDCQGALSAILGLAKGGLGTHQDSERRRTNPR